MLGDLLMGLLLQVNQPNDLVLVQCQQDWLGILAPRWGKMSRLVVRHKSDGTVAVLAWTRPPLFSVYTDYTAYLENCQ